MMRRQHRVLNVGKGGVVVRWSPDRTSWRGDAEAVTVLLEAGADPDTVTGDGPPVLCWRSPPMTPLSRVRWSGAARTRTVDCRARRPLLRAVDGGSPAMTRALPGDDPLQRLPDAERERLLALARRWYERGAEVKLRDRAGSSGLCTRSASRMASTTAWPG